MKSERGLFTSVQGVRELISEQWAVCSGQWAEGKKEMANVNSSPLPVPLFPLPHDESCVTLPGDY
jgi:hypothetical protein